MTRTGKRATEEQRAASEYLGSLGDALARWVQSTGPIDAYDAHLPVEVGSPLEWFSYAVISRQLTRASSSAIYRRLTEEFGGGLTAEGVLMAGEQTLRTVGLSHQKARTIWMLAARADDGVLEPDGLATMANAEIEAKLVAVPGIGPSSAQRFLLHYLHRPDIFLPGDPAVRASITALDRLDSGITPKAAEQRSEPWRPFRSYATSYLWGYVWEASSSGPL